MPLRLIKRGDVWHVTGTVRGRSIRKTTGTSDKAAAEAIRVQWESEALSRSVFGDKAEATFAEAALMYLDAGGESRFIGKLATWFGTMKLRDITQYTVDECARVLYPDASNATRVRQVYVPVTAILRRASRANLCDKPDFTRPKVKHRERTVPNEEWWAKVLPECSDHLAALLLFLSLTGARISEATRLEWADIDEEAKTALLRQTKTKPRLVDIPQPLWTRMAALKRYDRVFLFTHPNSYRKALKTACKRAGVRYHSSHEIGRHSFATALLRAGASIALVKELGGWETGRLVMGTYGHLERKDAGEMLEAIAARRSPKLKEVK